MNFLLYGLPVLVFIIVAIVMYTISADENKNNFSTIFVRNILPSLVIALVVFTIIKFKNSQAFDYEPMKTGSFFEN
jgi:hypothetical protein